jgi:hypothetical protein
MGDWSLDSVSHRSFPFGWRLRRRLRRLFTFLVDLQHTFEELAVSLLQILERNALIGGMTQMLLEKLQASPVFGDNLAPCLDADRRIPALANKPPLRIGTTVDLVAGVVIVCIRDDPKVPF